MFDVGNLYTIGVPTFIVGLTLYLIVLGFTKGNELRNKEDKTSGEKVKEFSYYFMSSVLLAMYSILGYYFFQKLIESRKESRKESISNPKYLMEKW